MFLVSIGIIKNFDMIKQYITNKLDILKEKGFFLFYDCVNVKNVCYIDCWTENSFCTQSEFNYVLAEIIGDAVINNLEDDYIWRMIKTNYNYLNYNEKKCLKTITDKFLYENENNIVQNGLYKANRKNFLTKNIILYLNESNILILDGFNRFRNKSYFIDLEDTVEKAYQYYLAEKEYNEFIKLLRYFVDLQDSRIDEVHILPCEESKYILLDSCGKKLSFEYLEDVAKDMVDESINEDDILISTLITIAPKKIYIHEIYKYKNKELLQTIKNVFCERVIICNKSEPGRIISISKEINKV